KGCAGLDQVRELVPKAPVALSPDDNVMGQTRRTSGSPGTADEGLVERFTTALWLERGLSENTRKAYRTDLFLLSHYLRKNGRTLASARSQDLWGFLSAETAAGLTARTAARRLASIRVFYRHLSRL